MREELSKLMRNIRDTFYHVHWLAYIVVPFLILINIAFVMMMRTQYQSIDFQLQTIANRELNNIELYMNTEFESVHNDLFVLTNANEISAYLLDQTEAKLDEVKGLFYRIAENKTDYKHITLINPNGDLLYKTTYENHVLSASSTNLGSITTNGYFPLLANLENRDIFISKIYASHDTYLISFITPIYMGNDIIFYVMIDYDANSFLNIFQIYSPNDLTFLSLGFVSDNTYWFIDESFEQIQVLTDPDMIADIKSEFDNPQGIVIKRFSIFQNSEDYVAEDNYDIDLFMHYHIEEAIKNSGSFLANNIWVIPVINVFLILLFGYIAYMILMKTKSQLLINANAYLTAQNENAIIITNRKLNITYVNPTFEKIFDYTFEEAINQNIHELMTYRVLYPDISLKQEVFIDENHWYLTKHDIYLLKFIQVKKIKSFGRLDTHYIVIYSDPKIEVEDYMAYINNHQATVQEILPLLSLFPFVIHKSMLMMIQVSHTESMRFATFVKQYSGPDVVIAVPKANHVLIYKTLNDDETYEDVISSVDDIIELYRYDKDTSPDFSHRFTVAKAEEDITSLEKLIGGVIVALSFRQNQHLKHYIYDANMKQRIEKQYAVYQSLETAFNEDEFYLNYQIQYDITQNKFFGAEALLRWHSKTLGQVYPSDFIPVIENSYYVNRLSTHVVSLVIEDLKTHEKELPDDFRISINLTSFDFSTDYVIGQLIQIIEESDISTSRFVFEITESMYLDNTESTNRVLNTLHEKNIKVAIDDFGTGYSSINSLKSINVDYVKTERQYMMGYPTKDDGLMLERMIHLIQSLNKPVIVEGTETQEQVDFCKHHQVMIVQGYFISKPVPMIEMINTYFKKKTDTK